METKTELRDRFEGTVWRELLWEEYAGRVHYGVRVARGTTPESDFYISFYEDQLTGKCVGHITREPLTKDEILSRIRKEVQEAHEAARQLLQERPSGMTCL